MIASNGNKAISQFRKVFAITGKNTIMGIETELGIAKVLGAIRGFTKPVRLSELSGAINEL